MMKWILISMLFSSVQAWATNLCPEILTYTLRSDEKCPETCYVPKGQKIHFQMKDLNPGMEFTMKLLPSKNTGEIPEDIIKCPNEATIFAGPKENGEWTYLKCINKSNAGFQVQTSFMDSSTPEEEFVKYPDHVKVLFFSCCPTRYTKDGMTLCGQEPKTAPTSISK